MRTSLITLAIAVAGLAGIGCSSSSTAPNAAVAGSWVVTWLNLPAGTVMSPSVDTLTIVQNGSSYAATYSDIVYTVNVSTFYAYVAIASGSSFAVSGNNVTWHAGDAGNASCYLAVVGTVSGSTMQGTASQSGGGMCPTAAWAWSATKQ